MSPLPPPERALPAGATYDVFAPALAAGDRRPALTAGSAADQLSTLAAFLPGLLHALNAGRHPGAAAACQAAHEHVKALYGQHRRDTRHHGRLWTLWTVTGPHVPGDAGPTLHLRHSNGSVERIPLPDGTPDLSRPVWPIRRPSSHAGRTAAKVEFTHVHPRLPEPHHATTAHVHEGLNVILLAQGYRAHHRDPGVLEYHRAALHVNVKRRASPTGGVPDIQFQQRIRHTTLQLNGTRLLYLQGGAVRNLSAGALPQLLLQDPDLPAALAHFTDVLAARALTPGALRQYRQLAPQWSPAERLAATRWPALLSHPSLLAYAQQTSGRARRRMLADKGGATALLHRLIGPFPRAGRHLLRDAGRFTLARLVHAAGITCPARKARLLRALRPSSGVDRLGLTGRWWDLDHSLDPGNDEAWCDLSVLVRAFGEREAARKLERSLLGGVNLGPDRPAGRLNARNWKTPARFVAVPAGNARLPGTASPRRSPQWKGPVASRPVRFPRERTLESVLFRWRDTLRMYRDLNALQPMPFPGGSLDDAHDTLAALHWELTVPDRAVPTGTEEALAGLDQDLDDATWGRLSFRRARGTHELAMAGRDLHNCVSGYADWAVGGHCVIVIARDPAGRPRYCLDFRPPLHLGAAWRLVQYRADFNEAPEIAHLPVAAQYVLAAGVLPCTDDLPDDLLHAPHTALTRPPEEPAA